MPLQVVETRRPCCRIADQQRVRIPAREWPLDSRLPPERGLAALLGVSRPSMREARIALEVEGLVDARMGSGFDVKALYAPCPGAIGEASLGPLRQHPRVRPCRIRTGRARRQGLHAAAAEAAARSFMPIRGDCATHIARAEASSNAALRRGVELIMQLLPAANRVTRQPVAASHLTVGLQCGGSDGYSGISANPALGAAVDRLVRHGGMAILSETPEVYGGEHLLTRRAVSREVADKLLARIRWWEQYTARNGMKMDNNPSAGNKAGGLTTILEKSLGAIAKSGTTNLVDVVEFAQPVTARGLVFMDTPGYDPVSATGQVAGGANLICFTTGRGSAYGCAPSPSLKFSTNTALWRRQEDDIDLDCGGVVEGTDSVDVCGERIFRLMLDTASGRKTKSELHGYGHNEFVPWQLGR